jgi:hypothetical protein
VIFVKLGIFFFFFFIEVKLRYKLIINVYIIKFSFLKWLKYHFFNYYIFAFPKKLSCIQIC